MKIVRSMVLVSGDPVSLQRGANTVVQRIQNKLAEFDLLDEVSVSMFSEVGRHDSLPMVLVYPEAVVYGPVSTNEVDMIVTEHLYKGRIAKSLLAPPKELSGKIAWIHARKGTLPAEQRIVLQRVGLIDPTDIEDYIIHDGYQALIKVITEMTPSDVITELKNSGLKGRGGAGFPTGLKWSFVAKTPGKVKYIVCNADESEPGTFKDRMILEGDPHSIIEAMCIAGYAIGASEGYIYIRGEYALAYDRLKEAIQTAGDMGFLGKNIMGSNFSFDIHIHAGAGAYICGEETALIESIEGNRGEPRPRPPYPTTNGLWDKPTLVNNVETLANVPPILRNGSKWYKQFGTPSSPGTKVYTILGNVNVTGLIEVPMGITLREVISIYGGGMKDGIDFKFAQTGGSSGSIIPAALQDTPMDFDSYSKAGVSLGSGALLICNNEVCVVDLAIVLMNFFRNESCGKCNPCRIGNQRAYQILRNIAEGVGVPDDLENLKLLSNNLYEMSNCGLGQTAGTPIHDILTHFKAEIDAHILLKVCPSGVCPMSGQIYYS